MRFLQPGEELGEAAAPRRSIPGRQKDLLLLEDSSRISPIPTTSPHCVLPVRSCLLPSIALSAPHTAATLSLALPSGLQLFFPAAARSLLRVLSASPPSDPAPCARRIHCPTLSAIAPLPKDSLSRATILLRQSAGSAIAAHVCAVHPFGPRSTSPPRQIQRRSPGPHSSCNCSSDSCVALGAALPASLARAPFPGPD